MSLDFPSLGRAAASGAERFLQFVEQLEQAILLLESGRIARQRMALVAIDNLAEGLIFHHLQKIFLASDEPTWVKHREFPAKERREAQLLPTSLSAHGPAEIRGDGPAAVYDHRWASRDAQGLLLIAEPGDVGGHWLATVTDGRRRLVW